MESNLQKKTFTNFLNVNNIKRQNRYTSKEAVFAGRFNRTITNLLKKLAFEKGYEYWID